MLASCQFCQTGFDITAEDLVFYDKVSPVFDGKKYPMPPPKLCPKCRQQRRLTWRNERFLYNRTCDLCRQDMISLYSPDKPFPVYCKDCWWSDSYDPLQYGQNFDSNKSLFEQLQTLLLQVPKLGMINMNCQNSDYSLFCGDLKNCYLVFSAVGSEDCLYGHQCNWNKDCVDVSFCYNSELCYEAVDCRNCYHCQHIQNCERCTDCQYCYGCQGCSNCFLCVNLNNKQYCIENQQYTKEEYEKKLKTFLVSPGAINKAKIKLNSLEQQGIQKFAHLVNCENCTGDYLRQCKNCQHCFDAIDLEDGCYIWTSIGAQTSMDCCYIAKKSELCYEGMSVFPGYRLIATDYCWDSSDVFYSSLCMHSKNCFGCVGLKKAEYCILNKQYSKEEYEQLVPKIIEGMLQRGEYGEFFPSSLSPFGYNETVAQEYFPLARQQVVGNADLHSLQDKFDWSDYVPPKPDVQKVIPASKLPDTIKDIPDDILNWAIECEVTGKPFRIIKQELKFYREHNLPIPRRHPDQRHKDRMALRNPRKLWTRQCDCTNAQHQHERVGTTLGLSLPDNATNRCPQQFQTTYAPDRSEKVYCEECYLREVY